MIVLPCGEEFVTIR